MSRAERRRAPGHALAALAFALCLCAALGAPAQEPGTGRADDVKAAYVINFLRYTDWPAASFPARDSPFRILVLGRPELLDAVRRLASAAGRISGRPVDVERMELPELGSLVGSEPRAHIAAQLRKCHVLFIERNESEHADDLLSLVRDYPVLTVSDVDRFAESGGMLELLPRGANIVLAANPGAIRRSDLIVSAKVLKLAKLVGDAETPR